VLQVMERERLMENAATTGAYMKQRLHHLASKHAALGTVRGTGLLLGLEIRGNNTQGAASLTKRIVNTLASRARILIGSEGPSATTLKLRPPMSFHPEHVDMLVAAIDSAVGEAADA